MTYSKLSSTSSAASVSENRLNGSCKLGFEIFENRYNFFNSRLVDHTVRSIDEQTNVIVKFDVRWKFHRSLTGDPPLFGCSAARTFNQPFQRNTQPFRGVFSLLEYSDPDRRVLSDYGMQLAIMDNGGVGRQNCRFHRWTVAIRKNSMERNLNNVSEIQLDLIVTQGIEESIERLLQSGF